MTERDETEDILAELRAILKRQQASLEQTRQAVARLGQVFDNDPGQPSQPVPGR